jgi:hypothetical protein
MVRCRVCSSDRRAAIEAAVQTGGDVGAVASTYGVSELALRKHLDTHPRAPAPKAAKAPPPKRTRAERAHSPPPAPPAPAAAVEDEAPITSKSPSAVTARSKVDELLEELSRLSRSLGAEAPVADKIAILRASVPPIKLLGQLTRELGASETTVATSPHYRRIRAVIVDALRPFPAAARAVLSAIEREERGTADVSEAAE